MPRYPEQAGIGVMFLCISLLMIAAGLFLCRKFSLPQYSMDCMFRNIRELFTVRVALYLLGAILSFFGICSSLIAAMIVLTAFF
ncbi:MAG: hypothetical protein AB2L14_24480 [Candidatus Xenobiia bacterium LiM19]